jgi:hypothetical protein
MLDRTVHSAPRAARLASVGPVELDDVDGDGVEAELDGCGAGGAASSGCDAGAGGAASDGMRITISEELDAAGTDGIGNCGAC